MKATATATVSAPIDRVWTLLSDHEGMTGWAPGLKSTLTKAGSSERNGLGAVRKISTPLPAPAIVEEIVAFEPKQRLSYKALSGVPLKNYVGDVVLTPVAGGTSISYTISADKRVPGFDNVAVKVIARTLLSMLVRQAKKSA